MVSAKSLILHTVRYMLWLFFGSVLFQSLFFHLNLSINALCLLLATLLYLAYEFWKEKKVPVEGLIGVALVWLFLSACYLYFRDYHEASYDGLAYHGNAIVNMIKGWNPFKDTAERTDEYICLWAMVYPKASWFFSAQLIALYNHLSTGMVLTVYSSLMTGLYLLNLMLEEKKSICFSIIVSFMVFLNPIAIEQIHTYYNDALLGNLTFLLALLGYRMIKKPQKHLLIPIVMTSALIINLKFSGFGFAGVINLIVYIAVLFKDRKIFVLYTFAGILLLLISICVIGYNPYLLNIVNKRHIFYPIAGKNARDIMTHLTPNEILPLNSLQRFFYSLTCGENMYNLTSFRAEEYMYYDQRIGAMGHYTFRLLIISAIMLLIIFIKDTIQKRFDLAYWLSLFALLISMALNYKNIWWLRYIPQLYFLIPWALFKTKFKGNSIIGSLMLVVLLFQGFTLYLEVDNLDKLKTDDFNKFYDAYRNKETDITVVHFFEPNNRCFEVYEVYRAEKNGVILTVSPQVWDEKEKMYNMIYYGIYINETK